PPVYGCPQRPERAQGFRLVDDDELDVRNMTEQLGLYTADDPRKRSFRPRTLQGAHDRQYMARIADRREAQDADTSRDAIERGGHGARAVGLWVPGCWPE